MHCFVLFDSNFKQNENLICNNVIHSTSLSFQRTPVVRGRIAGQRASTTITKRSKKAEEPVILTLSSDEEDDDNTNSKVCKIR